MFYHLTKFEPMVVEIHQICVIDISRSLFRQQRCYFHLTSDNSWTKQFTVK